MKKILLFVLLCLFCIQSSQVNAFLFWLKSSDNTVEDIINLEKSYNLYLPLIWFIYDPWEQQDVIWNLKDMAQLLWNQRIYHITISPDSYSAADVANWKFDEQYSAFFKTIKELNLKVIFRTMHEVNWGWYPWSWNPDEFKKAWNHVWNLSRSLWLTNHDILFDFSVNHRDMPTNWIPSQTAKLIECQTPRTWEKKNILDYSKDCYRFEDYYPWDKYVDIVGVTFYNRWKATSNRLWKTPSQILGDKNWNTVLRLKKFWKPLFIDEVWTTAVWYNWAYSAEKSKSVYDWTWGDYRKNTRLKQLSEYLTENNFLWAVYFNVDYTYWLQYPSVWETDWAIINPALNKFYDWFRDLYSSFELDFQNILDLFWLTSVIINWKAYYAPSYATKNISFIDPIVTDYFSWDSKKISDFYKKLIKTSSWKKEFDEAVSTLSKIYNININENLSWNTSF